MMRRKLSIIGLICLLMVLPACGSKEVENKWTADEQRTESKNEDENKETELDKDISYNVSEEEVYWKDEFLPPDSECTMLTPATNEITNLPWAKLKDGVVTIVEDNSSEVYFLEDRDYSALVGEVIYDTAYAKITITDVSTVEYRRNVNKIYVDVENKLPVDLRVTFKDIFVNGCSTGEMNDSVICVDALSTKNDYISLDGDDFYMHFWGIEKAVNLSGRLSLEATTVETTGASVYDKSYESLDYGEVYFVCGDAHTKQRREYGGAITSVDDITVEMSSPRIERNSMKMYCVVRNNTDERIEFSYTYVTINGEEKSDLIWEYITPGCAEHFFIWVVNCVPEGGFTEAFVTFEFELEDGTTVTTVPIRIVNN